MSAAEYDCPQCNGNLSNGDGSYTCEDCGLNVTEVLEHLESNDGPLADIAEQLREGMAE